MHPFERFKNVKAYAREADLASYRRLIDHCHAWSDADASAVAVLQQRLALDDDAIAVDIDEHLADAGQREAARNRIKQYRTASEKRMVLQHAAAFESIPDATRWTIYESLLAKFCSDPDTPAISGRDPTISDYLCSRDYSQGASGLWMKDGVPYERDIAVNMEFVMDYETASDACDAWLAVPPTSAPPEEVSEEMVAALEAEIDNMEQTEDSLALAEVLVVGYQAYCDPSADRQVALRYLADRLQKDRAELDRRIADRRCRPRAMESI